MYKRWYDADPVVGSAIRIFEKSDYILKNSLAELIFKEVADRGVVSNKDEFDCFWHRRQNDNAKFQKALEYLKNMDFETKKEISFKIIEFSKNQKNSP